MDMLKRYTGLSCLRLGKKPKTLDEGFAKDALANRVLSPQTQL